MSAEPCPMLISINIQGNIHEAVQAVNSMRYVQYLFQLVALSGNGSIAVLKVPDLDTYNRVRKELGREPI